MKKIAILAAVLAMACSCGQNAAKKQAEAEKAAADSIAAAEAAALAEAEARMATLAEEPIFDIITTEGLIRVRLYKETPGHRDNFSKLALSGFYDGTLFHRVIKGFMIQGGDPLTKDESKKDSWGTGGPGYQIPAEIIPELTHKRGALAAARKGDTANPFRESSGSQFYIVQDPVGCSHLDGQYTIFGETISGFGVVDKITRVAVDQRSCPLTPVKIVKIKLYEGDPAEAAAKGVKE